MSGHPEVLWQPSAEQIEATNLAAYVGWLNRERGSSFAASDYKTLQAWSSTEIEQFWASIWDYFTVDADGDAGRAGQASAARSGSSQGGDCTDADEDPDAAYIAR